MIRYNANDPDIHGKKSYNILRGFGWWCITFAAFAALETFIILNQIEFFDSGLIASLLIMLLFVFDVAFFGTVGLSIQLRYREATSAIITMSRWGVYYLWLFFPTQIILQGIYCASGQPYHAGALMVEWCIKITLVTVLHIWLLGALRKIFENEFVQSWLTSRNPPEAINRSSEPDAIALFETWDPLLSFSKYQMIVGVILLTLGLLIGCFYWMDTVVGAFILIGPIITLCGYGLWQRKEWSRTFGIVLHGMILLIPFFGFIGSLFGGMYPQNAVWLAIGFYPLWHACYFVIRSLSHPVVKYVCLRSGHDIE